MEAMKRSMSLVSVIIVNWNGGGVLRDCLESLSKVRYPNWELVVVDNGSTDESLVLIRKLKVKSQKLKVKVVRNKENVGFARANNQGLKMTKGEYILLLNNDTKVEEDLLGKMVEKMEGEKDLGVVQPKIMMMDNPGYLDNAGSFLTWIGFLDHWGFGRKDGEEFSEEKEIFSAKGACMLIRREVVEKVGLFDEDYVSYFEESDFCWRVWLGGYRVLFFPKVKIFHKVGFTIKRMDVWGNNFHYYKNRICSLLKNLEVPNLLVILPLHLVVSMGIAMAFALRGHLRNSLIVFKAMWWNLVSIPSTLRKRREVVKIRVVGDREIFAKLMRRIDLGRYWNDFRRVERDLGS